MKSNKMREEMINSFSDDLKKEQGTVAGKDKFNKTQRDQIQLGLEKGVDVKAYADPKFSHEQMEQIRMGLEKGVDVSVYADPNYDPAQMLEIRKGLQDGLDVSFYADPQLTHEQMGQIQMGLKERVDVSRYANPKFDKRQMLEIRMGLKKGVNVSFYADSKFTHEQMEQIREGLEKGVDVSVYAKPQYDNWQMLEIRKGLEKGVDVSSYINSQFDDEQMLEIRKGLESGVDVSLYATQDLDDMQMLEIRMGLEKGVNVSLYADPDYDFLQMEQIRKGLESRVDVSLYATQNFNALQMIEIREGLEKGVDVSVYADPKYDNLQMLEIRMGLEKGKNSLKKELAKKNENNKASSQNKFYNREESERMSQWMKDNISIVDVCQSLGYSPVRVGQRYYSLKEHDSVRLDVEKNCFYWNSIGEKGSVIDVCTALGNMSKSEAYEHLYGMAGGREAVYEASNGNQGAPFYHQQKSKGNIRPQKEKVNFSKVELPKKGSTYRNLYAYLGKTRQISNDIIKDFIAKDMLYQDDRNNCVFVSRDKTGEPVFACKRGTNTFKRFVADCRGNDYSKGFYVDNGSDKLFVGESVIDIMSKMTILQKEGLDYHDYNYLALAGTGKQEPIKNICKENSMIQEIVIGMDNDEAGWMASLNIERSFKGTDIKVTADIPGKSGQDWNDVLCGMEKSEKKSDCGERAENYSEFVKQHEEAVKGKNLERTTVVINAYGGPGSGKTTSCMDICAGLKKEGYNAEYVQEYAKELVYDNNMDLLDGTSAHQFEMLKEQMHRMDRLIGKTDFIVTDSPLILNVVYNQQLTPAYEKMVSEVAGHFTNFSYFMKRDDKAFQKEGRIHNLSQSKQKDEEIQALLKKHDINYGIYTHDTVDIVVKNAIANYKKMLSEQTREEGRKEAISMSGSREGDINWSDGKKESDNIFSMVNGDRMKQPVNDIWKNAPKIKQPIKMLPGLER